MADVLVNHLCPDSVFQLVGDKSMPQIVYFDIFYTGFFEIAVNTGANISDEQRAAGFGNENVVISNLGTNTKIIRK